MCVVCVSVFCRALGQYPHFKTHDPNKPKNSFKTIQEFTGYFYTFADECVRASVFRGGFMYCTHDFWLFILKMFLRIHWIRMLRNEKERNIKHLKQYFNFLYLVAVGVAFT